MPEAHQSTLKRQSPFKTLASVAVAENAVGERIEKTRDEARLAKPALCPVLCAMNGTGRGLEAATKRQRKKAPPVSFEIRLLQARRGNDHCSGTTPDSVAPQCKISHSAASGIENCIALKVASPDEKARRGIGCSHEIAAVCCCENNHRAARSTLESSRETSGFA